MVEMNNQILHYILNNPLEIFSITKILLRKIVFLYRFVSWLFWILFYKRKCIQYFNIYLIMADWANTNEEESNFKKKKRIFYF